MKASTSCNMKGKHAKSPKKRVLEIEEPPKCRSPRKAYNQDSLSRRKRRKPERERKNIMSTPKEDCKNITRKANCCKKRTILSWLIDVNAVEENVEVFSIDEESRQMRKKGRIKREGIECKCCNEVFSVEKFHVHCGRGCREPYECVLIEETKISLMSCMIEAWNDREESECCMYNGIEMKGSTGDIYDDACMICADGGDLMCCDNCSSTYHPVCIGLEDVPEDSWYCPYCVCKYCGKPARANDYLLECPQCEKKYHWECHDQMKEEKRMDLNIIPIAPFCERRCREVFDKLTKTFVGKRQELEEGYSWSLLHQMNDGGGVYVEDNYSRALCHSKLAVAKRIMEECFEPIEDRYTRIKVIPSVVYNCGSNFRRINYRGFYTAILEKDDEIISVASLRIHGTKLAEMPFIATSEAYRRRGMCRQLMVAIESALCYLNVENLIIPSVPEKTGNWIQGYAFCPLHLSMEKQIKVHSTVMFHDSVRLQKVLQSSSH